MFLYFLASMLLCHMNYNKIYLILATASGINICFGFFPKIVAFILGAALLILSAMAYSQKRDGKLTAGGLAAASVAFLTLLALLSVPLFYISHLGKFFTILCLIIIFAKTKNTNIKFSFRIPSFFNLTTYYLLLTTFLLYLLAKSASGGSIQSPWLQLPAYFLPLFFLATALLIFLLHKKNSSFFLAAHFLIFFSVAAFIYKFGYGFDQFIHEAAQKYIAEHGSISPKSIQYIGLYGINIFLHYATGISFTALNAYLLPAASALLPLIAYKALKEKIAARPLSILALLLLPLSYFIVTTPQGLANLLLLILIFLPAPRSSKSEVGSLERPAGRNFNQGWALPFAIFFIHPITGIIGLAYMGLLRLRFKKIITAIGVFALPAAFTLLSFKSGGGLRLNFNLESAMKEYSELLTFGAFKQNYNFWLDLIYLIQYLALPAIIIVSICVSMRYKEQISRIPLYLFGIATASYFATAIFADFSYLIGYEQKNYPERLFYISFLFLAPYLVLAVEKIYIKLTSPPFQRGGGGGLVYKIFFAGLFAFAVTANFYLTYPRWDNYQNDKGKNITAGMLRAAELVEKDAGDKKYAVLTDQAVSAAALKLYGFKKYYSTPLGDVFYYSIPTGGPLYNEFLNLIYNNVGVKSARNAKILTGADIVYIVLPSYWENYEKIKENLKTEMRVIFEDKNIAVLKY